MRVTIMDGSELDLQAAVRPSRRESRVIVRTADRVLFLRPEEIDWIEAAGNYVRVHARGERHLLKTTMKDAERRLDPNDFLRIHRSAIVNVDRIRALTPWAHGEYVVTMHDGMRLHVSRVYSARVNALIDSCGL